MKKLILFIVIIVSITHVNCLSQTGDSIKRTKSIADLGIGLGVDYGGIGARITVKPVREISLFLGAGTNIVGIGYNVGGALHPAPKAKFSPKLIAMYGYNGVLMVAGMKKYNKIYYGATVGIGLEYHWSPKMFWNFELLYPFREQKFWDDADIIKNDPNVGKMTGPYPIAYSIGFHFNL